MPGDVSGNLPAAGLDDWEHGFWDEYRQSTMACCPRQTIPDSCSCLEGCDCMCLDCICAAWGEEHEDG